jgi:hypothetical protein
MFRAVPLSITRSLSLYTQQWYLSANLHDINHCCVYSEKTPDDRQRNCPKHVMFPSKNKLEKLVHLVGFIIRNRLNQFQDTKFDEKVLACIPYRVLITS